MAEFLPRIVGTGYAAPKTIRNNNDPIFDWIKQNKPKVDPFKGYKQRRVLAKGEDLMTIMLPAASKLVMTGGGGRPGTGGRMGGTVNG